MFGSFPAPLDLDLEMKTHLPKVNLDQRKWHVIDANGAVLGRLAVQVANILRGKNKPVYTPHLDAGDFVVVINAEKVLLTGKKETDKNFMTYSGWKGGEKYRSVEQVRASASGAPHHPRRQGHGSQEPPRPRAPDQAQSVQGRPASALRPSSPRRWPRPSKIFPTELYWYG